MLTAQTLTKTATEIVNRSTVPQSEYWAESVRRQKAVALRHALLESKFQNFYYEYIRKYQNDINNITGAYLFKSEPKDGKSRFFILDTSKRKIRRRLRKANRLAKRQRRSQRRREAKKLARKGERSNATP